MPSTYTQPWTRVLIWLIGSALVPLLLIVYVALEGAGWDGATMQGELLAITVGVTAASAALETLMPGGTQSIDLFRGFQVVFLIATVLYFTGQVDVSDSKVTTTVSGVESHGSIVLFLFAVLQAGYSVYRDSPAATSSAFPPVPPA